IFRTAEIRRRPDARRMRGANARRSQGGSMKLASLMLLAVTAIAAQHVDPDSTVAHPRVHRMGARAIPNHYIVVLDRDATGLAGDRAANAAQIAALVPGWNGVVTRRFDHALNGFAAFLSEQQAEALSEDPRVAFVEEDSTMEALTTQTNPPWGLD